jgi:hypothetical protein
MRRDDLIRTYPQPRFSVATRTTNSSISFLVAGRPGLRRALPSYLFAISFRCRPSRWILLCRGLARAKKSRATWSLPAGHVNITKPMVDGMPSSDVRGMDSFQSTGSAGGGPADRECRLRRRRNYPARAGGSEG